MAVRKFFSLYGAMLLKNMRESTAYKFDFILGILAHLLIQASSLLLVMTVYTHTDSMGGFTFEQSLILYGCSLLATGIEEFFLPNVWSISRHVNMGTLDSVLLRPVKPILMLVMDGTSIHGFILGICGVVCLIVGFAQGGISFGGWKCLWLILCSVSGAFIIFSITLIMETLAFWFTDVVNAVVMVDNLRQFVRYPITIYQPFIRNILIFIIPYSFTSFFPAALMLDMEEYLYYAYFTPLIALSMVIIASLFFQFGLKFYHSSGGGQ